MATDFVLSTGDQLVIQPLFGKATVTVPPAPLTGSGSPIGLLKTAVCVQGDELPKALQVPLPYISGNFVTPGAGLISIQLDDTHWTTMLKCGGKKVLLVGGTVKATFQVTVPATQPSGPAVIPDPVPQYSGTGKYVTSSNTIFKAA